MRYPGFVINGFSNNSQWCVKFFLYREKAEEYLGNLNAAVDLILEQHGHIVPESVITELDPNIKGCYNSIKYSIEEVLVE